MEEITINEKDHRFELLLEDQKAYIDYQWKGDVLQLVYIYVPPKFRGQGNSEQLIRFAIQFAKERKVKINVICTYMQHYLRMHPELAEGLMDA